MEVKMKYDKNIVLIIFILLLILSFIFPDIPGPASWLISWTGWLAAVVGIFAGIRAIMIGCKLATIYLKE